MRCSSKPMAVARLNLFARPYARACLALWCCAVLLACTKPDAKSMLESATDRQAAAQEVAPSKPTGRTVRFLSFAVRDRPPTAAETRAFLSGEKSLDALVESWLASPDHLARMRRYFSDFFGITVGFTPMYYHHLVRDEAGVYRHFEEAPCAAGDALDVKAWWAESNQTVKMCPSSVSDAFSYPGAEPDTVVQCENYYSFTSDPRCGCGPYQLLCVPEGEDRQMEFDFNKEPVERGMYVYQNRLSWFDYIGGDFLIATRRLLLYYMHAQGALITGRLDPDKAAQSLWALRMNEWSRTDFPAGAARAGLVTSPGYLNTFNTFRGRVRILSQKLLCHDVDASLNPDNYQQFLNPDFTDGDRAHGALQGCSYCHYGMDNHASTLFGYDISGRYEFDHARQRSQLGRVFGSDGTGPAFLVRGYTERAEGFASCMASSTFTSLTGLHYEEALSEPQRAQFEAIAKQGPYQTVQEILRHRVLQSSD